MKNLILIITAALCFAAGSEAQTHSFAGEVVKVSDGDTFTFRHSDGNLDKVRMLGIDAPETAHNSKEVSQPYADICRVFLSNLIAGKTVTIESSRRDGYGRNLARVIAGDADVNLAVVKAGCAWLYYPNGIRADLRAEYQLAFLTARDNRDGLFDNAEAVTPEVWRRRKYSVRRR